MDVTGVTRVTRAILGKMMQQNLMAMKEKFSPHNMAQNPIYHFRNSHKLQIPQMQRHACDNTRRT